MANFWKTSEDVVNSNVAKYISLSSSIDFDHEKASFLKSAANA
jgi:hypothetical protein